MKQTKYFAKQRRNPAKRIALKRKLVDLLGGKCIDCGYSAHLAALDFDHVNPKTKKHSIAKLLDTDIDYEVLMTEVYKCVIRCANCHRIRTHPDATD